MYELPKDEKAKAPKLYECIRDLQGGEFGVGRIQTAEEWGQTARDWADADGIDNPDFWLLEGWGGDEKALIDDIQTWWEIEIVAFKGTYDDAQKKLKERGLLY